MRYEQKDLKQGQRPGTKTFLHEVELRMDRRHRPPLEEFLAEGFGEKHVDWRIRGDWRHEGDNYYNRKSYYVIVVRFADRNAAMRFKLSWAEPSS